MTRTMFALLLGAGCAFAYAQEVHVVQVERFTMIDVGQGISAKVECGNSNSVTVNADQETLDKMKLTAAGGVLKISRGFSFRMLKHLKETIPVTITTESDVSTLEASTGSTLEVDGCAIDDEEVSISVKSAGDMTVAGKTDLVNLDVGSAGKFNIAFHASDLEADRAVIDISAGGVAGLCKVDKIEGKASTKSQVMTAADSEMQIKLSFGAEVTHVGC